MTTHTDSDDPKNSDAVDGLEADFSEVDIDTDVDADAKEDSFEAEDSLDDEVENRHIEILPPEITHLEPKRGVGFGTVLTCTLLASLIGAGGGFALSYSLMPHLRPQADTGGLETKIGVVSKENAALKTQILQLKTTVESNDPARLPADLTRLESRLTVLEDVPAPSIGSGATDELAALTAKVNALTAFKAEDGEAVPVEIARRLSTLEMTTNALSEAEPVVTEVTQVDPTTFMYGDTLLRDTLLEIIENQISLQEGTDTARETLAAVDVQISTLEAAIDTLVKAPLEKASLEKTSVVNSVASGAEPDDASDAASLYTPEPELNWSETLFDSFPEAKVRETLKEAKLSQKNWIARFIGENISVRKPGDRDEIDGIMDQIKAGDISGAIEKMETLPSPVRSSAQEWMKVARQARRETGK